MVLKMKPLAHLIILYTFIEIPYCSCEIFKPFFLVSPSSSNKDLCNEQTQSALVEDFFNTVFAEFPSSQPACVCIQLCAGHSTFCYPNGCFQHIKGYIRNKSDATLSAKPPTEEAVSESYIKYNEDKGVINDTFAYHAGNTRKLITPVTRRISLPVNPFKDRFKLLAYLNYKIPKTFRNNYYDFDHTEQERNIQTTNTAIIDMDNTQWPKTAYNNEQEKPEINNRISNDNNANSPTVDVKPQVEPFEKTDDKLISKKNLSNTRFDTVEYLKYKMKAKESEKLKVLPALMDESIPENLHPGDNSNITIDEGNDPEVEPKLTYRHRPNAEFDSITQIIVNATDNNEDFFRGAVRKSFLSRRLPLFDLRRLKNQIRRKNRLGNEVRSPHSRLGNKKKQNRLHHRVRDRQRRPFEIEPKPIREFRKAGKTKRSRWTDASTPQISMGDLEIFDTALEIATVAMEREFEMNDEHN